MGFPNSVLASEHLWIVDPIDGTSNFVHGIPHFGVSVAYYHHGEPACGVMGNPITRRLVHLRPAAKGPITTVSTFESPKMGGSTRS